MTPVMLANGLTRNAVVCSSVAVILAMLRAPAVNVFSECTTAFGRLVVPEVKSTTAGASRSGAPARTVEAPPPRCSNASSGITGLSTPARRRLRSFPEMMIRVSGNTSRANRRSAAPHRRSRSSVVALVRSSACGTPRPPQPCCRRPGWRRRWRRRSRGSSVAMPVVTDLASSP